MNIQGIFHEPKSNLSYAYDEETLHLRLKTPIGEVTKATVYAVDPFNWEETIEGTGIYEFNVNSIQKFDMQLECSTKLYDIWFAEVKGLKWLRIKYAFTVENESEKWLIGKSEPILATDENVIATANYFNFPYINPADIYKAPAWVKDTVWYQIFPERFCNGTPNKEGVSAWGEDTDVIGDKDVYRFYGGDINGIISKLDYIQEMGFTGIYFTPIFDAPSSHKYDTRDYFKIDPAFGDNEAFKVLVDEAHKRGIRVMLDAVFNHCGDKHPYWLDVLEKGYDSEYIDYFYIMDKTKPVTYVNEKKELNFRTFAFTSLMPKWNTENPNVRQYLLDAGEFWVKNYDIDGWRLDVSNEVSHSFWRDFRKVIHNVREDVYILGENWDNSYPWLMGDQMDAVMNYEFSYPIINLLAEDKYIKDRRYNTEEFVIAINKLLTSYPKHVTPNMFNLLDSHDTPRILTVCGDNEDKTLIALALLMTFAGTPSIYYGTEIGLKGNEQNNRKCMVWDETKQNKDMQNVIKKLINIRKNHSACSASEVEWLLAEDDKGIVYKKKDGNETLIVVINHTNESQEYQLPTGTYRSLINDCDVNGTVKLDTMKFDILVK